MQSPYYSGGGGNVSFMPPPGLAAMLAERDKELKDDAKSIGSFAGALGGGIAGAAQGAAKPGAFGAGTSASSGAAQGGLMNFAHAWNGQAGPGPTGEGGGFASLVGGGGGAGGGTSPNFKQYAAMGKAADSYRDAMKMGMPKTDDQEHDVFGTDDEWKTLSAQDKAGRVNGFVQANAQKEVMAKLSDYAAQAQQRQTQAEEADGLGQVFSNLPTKGSNPDGSFSTTDFVTAARGAKLAPRVQGSILSKFIQPQPKSDFTFDASKVTAVPGVDGATFVPTSRGGGQIVTNPAATLLATKPKPGDLQPWQIAEQSGKGWKVVNNPTMFKKTRTADLMNPGSFTETEEYVGPGNSAAKPAAAAQPAGNDVPALPANRKDWQVGQKYKTNKGVVTWNGQQFEQ